MKISVFLGRIHHAQKLLPVGLKLQEAGVDLEFIIANNSINIDPTTEYLHNFGINVFHHVNDYLYDVDHVAKVDARIASIDLSPLFSMVPPFWVMSSLREAYECLEGFGNYLDSSKPDAVFGLHENNFWVKMLFYLAKTKDISTYSLQEGIILDREEHDLGKYSIGTDYTDCLFSWSEYDVKYYSDQDKIYPVGPSHLDDWVKAAHDDVQRTQIREAIRKRYGIRNEQTVVMFAPPRLDLYRGDFMKALNKLIDWTRDRGITLLLSFHPFQGGVDQFKSISESYPHVIIRHDIQGLEYLFLSDVVITQTSTIGIEAVLLGKPVIELDMDFVGIEQPLWKQGAAVLLEGDNLNKIHTTLKSPLDTSEFINSRFPLADGLSANRIVEHIVVND